MIDPEKSKPERDAEREMRRISRRSFLWAGAAVLGVYEAFHWIDTRSQDGGEPWPLRVGLRANEGFWHDTFSEGSRSREYPPNTPVGDRLNSDIGAPDSVDPDTWTMTVSNVFGHKDDVTLNLADIKKLPRHDMITRFRCIEGWSVIVHWTGVRFRDFMKVYPPDTEDGHSPDIENDPDNLTSYVGMQTADGNYYVGLDMASCLHPQTMLAYAMNGKPLTFDHGAPLRLVMPVKYGVKNIKHIGSITYSDTRPDDYWADQGYDWYCGL